MDEAIAELPPLRSFVLPGGSRLNAELHICRTVCRRAERLAVSLSRRQEVDGDTLKYLNRLSDAFFVWSRWASRIAGTPALVAPSSRPGVVLSQPPISTAPSIGCERISSSVSMARKFR